MPKRKNKGGRNRARDEQAKDFLERYSDEDIMEIQSVSVEPKHETTQEQMQAPGPEVSTQLVELNLQIQKLQSRVQELEKQLENEKKEQLYIRAEFDTYRRRAIKERSDSLKYAGERAYIALLEVLDNFERALQVELTADNIASYRDGVRLIADEMRNLLKREGVEEVGSKDNNFDPNMFEAIGSEETLEKEPGQITRIFRKAYRLHDRIIRPGQVMVARAPAEKTKVGEES